MIDPPVTATAPAAVGDPAATSDRTRLRDLVSGSLSAGLCALIPIPFLDDWARDLVRRRLARAPLDERGVAATSDALDLLALGVEPSSVRSVALGCLQTVVVWPVRFLYKLVVKKLLRKVIFLLAVKDAVDTFSRTFHEGYLLRQAAALGHLRAADGHALDLASARPVRQAIDDVMREVDPRPVERTVRIVLRSSRGALRGAVATLGRGLRHLGARGRRDEDRVLREIERDVEGTEGIVDRLVSGLAEQASYLSRLRTLLGARLAAPSATPTPRRRDRTDPA